MGNCGFSLAPCAEKDKLLVMKNLERAELRRWITTWSMFGIQDLTLGERSVAGFSTEVLLLIAYGVISFLIASRPFSYDEEGDAI
jgi:hypothetical protein